MSDLFTFNCDVRFEFLNALNVCVHVCLKQDFYKNVYLVVSSINEQFIHRTVSEMFVKVRFVGVVD